EQRGDNLDCKDAPNSQDQARPVTIGIGGDDADTTGRTLRSCSLGVEPRCAAWLRAKARSRVSRCYSTTVTAWPSRSATGTASQRRWPSRSPRVKLIRMATRSAL